MTPRRSGPATVLTLAATLTTAFATTLTGVGAASATDADPGASARAGGSAWKKISTGKVDSLSEIAALRTADGVLHVVYGNEVGTDAKYQHTRLRPTGAVLDRGDVLGTWSALVANPVLLATGDGGMRLVFSGLQDSDTSNFFSSGRMYETTADETGAAWSLQPRALTKVKVAYSGYGTGAATLPDGTPVTATQQNSDLYYRIGGIDSTDPDTLTAATDDGTFTLDRCCGYDVDLATATDGSVWMTWYGNGGTAATNGTFVRRIYPTLGAIQKAPGSSVGAASVDTSQRVAMTARPDGSVWLAYASGYPTTTGIALWKVGASDAKVVRAGRDASRVALDANSSGRMWLAWAVGSSARPTYAVRTSPTGLRLGAVRKLGAVRGANYVSALTVDASLSQATVLANVNGSVWAQRVKPGMSLAASPGAWSAGHRRRVRFTVTDAGSGVADARVRGAGKSCRTNASGTCTITYPGRSAGRVTVTATKGGYGSDRKVLTVR